MLVTLDKEGNKTIVTKPWTNKLENVAAPVYHALGFDKLIFKKVEKILFVEGISDKFILEGLREIEEKLKEFYIHPLSGGVKLEGNELVEKIKALACLSNYAKKIEYKFVLDGDRKEVLKEKKLSTDNVIFLGNESQELEDLIDRDFYLQCVLEYYRSVFINRMDKFKKVEEIVNHIKKTSHNEKTEKITKHLDKMFKQRKIGSFSKTGVAILIKRKLKTEKIDKNVFSDLLEDLLPALEQKSKDRESSSEHSV